MAMDAELEALANRMQGARAMERARNAIKAGIYRRRVAAYRACFIGPDGEFTDAAKLVLGDLGRLAGIGKARLGRSTEEIQFDEGQRRIVLHLVNGVRIDPAVLARLAGRMRESDDE